MLIVLFVIALIAVIVFFVARQQSAKMVTALPTLPPVSDRTNPIPTSGYALSVGDVNPGNSLVVDLVELSQSASVVVVLDSANPQTIGKSTLLAAGSHNSVTIALSPAIKDGDVVIVKLMDANGKTIVNASNLPVQVKKNVGKLMTHYSNEY